MFGAAIGSVTPNLLAGLTANRNGKRSAILNLLFNLIRAGILLLIINLFPAVLDLIQSLSPNDVGRQIANTHTIFAIIAVLIELPFTNYIIKLACKIIPIKEEESQTQKDRSLQFMNQIPKAIPAVALHQAQMEITRMGRIAASNLQTSLDCFFEYDSSKAEKVREQEETVNILNHSISDCMAELRTLDLSAEHMRRVSMLTITITDIERLSDHAENIVEYIEQLRTKRSPMSEEAIAELKDMADNTMKAVNLSLDIFSTENYSMLDEIEELESRVDDQEKLLINSHVERLMSKDCNPLSGVIFADLVTDFERCSDHAINIAYALKERKNQYYT